MTLRNELFWSASLILYVRFRERFANPQLLKQLAVCKIMESLILYIHEKGGNAGEGEHYKSSFQTLKFMGLITNQILHGRTLV